MSDTNYPPQPANDDGWTDWISPTDIDMYGLQCCDCGLKHEMQFKVMRNKAYTDGVNWFADPVPAEEGYFASFRMRRDGPGGIGPHIAQKLQERNIIMPPGIAVRLAEMSEMAPKDHAAALDMRFLAALLQELWADASPAAAGHIAEENP